MSDYWLNIARVNFDGAFNTVVIEIPWEHFLHHLAASQYKLPFRGMEAHPVVISRSPEGKLLALGEDDQEWHRICDSRPPIELAWHAARVDFNVHACAESLVRNPQSGHVLMSALNEVQAGFDVSPP